ncbi:MULTISPECIES: PDGLE domain-containing protein [unclassified Halanaerobium]|uniref:PDGLE domain-containing protein n=1 Tax=unclassified Halanaerobium TaxID=2641197 RepID=UPI000DF3F804|nr:MULTISPECIES: PDGLE domain-containing protein [unclassified Halanaerobium]RCW50474.1 cobalt/nickel transport protein [Halanaerobium sp. MA284_MarDTE_T2]RCW85961.1 cobalt/nickel transport protein [Halanaerobium sp. DL-01]
MLKVNKYIYLIIAFIAFLAFLNPILSSSLPDGLEKVAETKNFINKAQDSFSIFEDYSLPINNELLSRGAAGLLGAIILYLLLLKIGKILSKN